MFCNSKLCCGFQLSMMMAHKYLSSVDPHLITFILFIFSFCHFTYIITSSFLSCFFSLDQNLMSTQHYSIIIVHKPETKSWPFLFGHGFRSVWDIICFVGMWLIMSNMFPLVCIGYDSSGPWFSICHEC